MTDDIPFAESGWARLRGFLDPGETAEAGRLVSEALRTPQAACTSRPGNDLHPLRWDDQIVAQVVASNSRVHRICNAVSASDLRWISGYLSTKPPRSPALIWHQDWWCWDHPVSFRYRAAQVALLCYLTPTAHTNGALRVLPGSHLRHTPLHQHLPEPHAVNIGAFSATHPAANDIPGQITVSAEAGDAIVIDYRLLHGTHANNSSERRDCVLLSFTPDWCALPADIKAHLIQHSALPAIAERDRCLACSYGGLLPDYEGRRRDLPINRLPPPGFDVIARS